MNKLAIVLYHAALVLLLTGCSLSNVEYVEVPVKCKADLPREPIKSDDDYETIKGLIMYLKKIKPVLHHCVEDTTPDY